VNRSRPTRLEEAARLRGDLGRRDTVQSTFEELRRLPDAELSRRYNAALREAEKVTHFRGRSIEDLVKLPADELYRVYREALAS